MSPLVLCAAISLAACGSSGGTPKATASSATTQAAAQDSVDTTLKAIYRRYQTDIGSNPAQADWDFPIYSTSLRALIEQWKKGFSEDEVAELQDFGWLCECQDWDPAKFTVQILPHPAPANGRAEVTVRFNSDGTEARDMRFELVDEGGKWMIDDIHAGSFEGGLRASLQRGIADAAKSKP